MRCAYLPGHESCGDILAFMLFRCCANGLYNPVFPTGNLLVLRDGRVGFIDFGIVGKISPVTFQAMEAFLMSTMTAE